MDSNWKHIPKLFFISARAYKYNYVRISTYINGLKHTWCVIDSGLNSKKIYMCVNIIIILNFTHGHDFGCIHRTITSRCRCLIIQVCSEKVAVYFLPNPHKIHHIARPNRRAMRWNFWFGTLIYILIQSMQCQRNVAWNIVLDWTAL